MAIAGFAVLGFGGYNHRTITLRRRSYFGGKYAEVGMIDTAGDISASDGIGILRQGERRASSSRPSYVQ